MQIRVRSMPMPGRAVAKNYIQETLGKWVSQNVRNLFTDASIFVTTMIKKNRWNSKDEATKAAEYVNLIESNINNALTKLVDEDELPPCDIDRVNKIITSHVDKHIQNLLKQANNSRAYFNHQDRTNYMLKFYTFMIIVILLAAFRRVQLAEDDASERINSVPALSMIGIIISAFVYYHQKYLRFSFGYADISRYEQQIQSELLNQSLLLPNKNYSEYQPADQQPQVGKESQRRYRKFASLTTKNPVETKDDIVAEDAYTSDELLNWSSTAIFKA